MRRGRKGTCRGGDGDGRELTGREKRRRGRKREDGGGKRDGSVGRSVEETSGGRMGPREKRKRKKGNTGCAGREDQIVEDGRKYRLWKSVRGRQAQVSESDLSRWVANGTRLSSSQQAGQGSDQGQGSTPTKVTQSRPQSSGSARAASLGVGVIICFVVLDARTGRRADGGREWGTGPGTRPYLYGGVGRGYHAACLVSSPPLAQI